MKKAKRDGRPGGGRPRMDMKSLRRVFRYLLNYRGQASLPYLFLLVAILAQLAVPRFIRLIIDTVTEGALAKIILEQLEMIPAEFVAQALPQLLTALDLPTGWTLAEVTQHFITLQIAAPDRLVALAVGVVAFAALRGVFVFLQAYWAERNSQSVAFDLRNDLFAKIQRLSFSYHDQNQTGQLMIRATDDVEKVRLFIGQGLLQLVGAFILIVGTLILLFTTNAALAWVAMPILPLAFVLFMIFGIISQPLFAEVQVRLSALNTVLQENLAGIKLVQAFVREREQQAKFRTAAERLMDQQIFLARLFAFLFPLVFLIASLGQTAILFYGGGQILAGTLTLGEWQEFSLYLIYLFLPIAQFGFVITQMGQASASATRLFELLDAQVDVADQPGARELPAIQGAVTFENVSFRYTSSGEPVLAEITLEAQPGETVALLGATGSGKTSIINLLPRFYDPTEGRVRIDGHDLREVTLDSLRKQIGIVLQETTLFAGTIAENIAYGKPEASQADIEAAAKAAAAHEFIQGFPLGYNTPVGERGSTLSGGQKQRIAIARALLLDPRILILDDSTSSVDLATEAEIQRALDGLMQGRTSFVIAQRISTVKNADQILVLEKGRVVARGRHADLMEGSPVYAEIYTSQLVDDAQPTGAA